ncbi:hypothetical protein MOUN0_L01024 [Monosporozyma unispora]
MIKVNNILNVQQLLSKSCNNVIKTCVINATLRNPCNHKYMTTSTQRTAQILTENHIHTINSPTLDTTHFFSSPNKTLKEPITSHRTNSKSASMDIGSAIRQYQNRKRWFAIWFTITTFLSLLIGYKIIYKVIYMRKESYIPFCPCSKYHKLTPKEQEKLNITNLKKFVATKLMGKLTSHNFIKEHYGVPLRISSNNEIENFDVWCEDEDLVVFGILFKANDGVRIDSQGKRWHPIPGLFKWKFSHQSVNIKERIQDTLDAIGIKYDKMITPEVTYGTFKYEVPIHGDDEHNHAMHICFYGELNLDRDSKVTFKGKYHVDVKFEEIDLLRNEEDKLVKYILYKEQ